MITLKSNTPVEFVIEQAGDLNFIVLSVDNFVNFSVIKIGRNYKIEVDVKLCLQGLTDYKLSSCLDAYKLLKIGRNKLLRCLEMTDYED